MKPVSVANQIIEDYDFIGITERFDESIVVLMMLLNLSFPDILHLNSKSTGGFDDGNSGRCTIIQKSSISDRMRQVFDSPAWRKHIYYEELLYKAANRSLDLTIEQLARQEVEKNVIIFKDAQSMVMKRCADKAIFPCMKKGAPLPPGKTNSLYRDSACGTPCIDQVAKQLGL